MNKFQKNNIKIPLFVKVVSLYVVLGIAIFSLQPNKPVEAVEITKPSNVSSVQKVAQPEKVIITGAPIRIEIPSLAIDLPIENGVYDSSTNIWQVKTGFVHFANMTSLPSTEPGNTFLYGHNNKKTLYATKKISTGAELRVYTSNGHQFSYQYTGEETVEPNNISIFATQHSVPTLTLMTCSGTWSQQRRLMNFALVEVQ